METSVKNYTVLGSCLKEIYEQEVVLEPNHDVKRELIEKFLDEFKYYCYNNCSVFSRLFKRIYLTGSYYEDLRVCHATEFDINFVLSFSSLNLKYEVKELENLPYVTFQVDKNSLNELEDDKLKSLFDGNYLILKKVHSWFQSNVAKFCSYCEKTSKFKDLGILKVEKSESGPACTLKLCTSSHVTKGNVGTSQFEHISVDLVPVFLIGVDHLSRYTYSNIHDLSEVDGQYCHMVPKPLKKELNFLKPSTASKAWRVSFPVQEKHTFADKEPLKIVMKLMKMLRDHENWKMPSYFCKAAAFWLVNKHPLSSYWSDSDLGDLFLECLDDFHKHLTLNHLGHIIYPNFNLLHTLTPNTIEQIRKRIQNIQGKLQRNPAYAYSLFKSYQLL